MKYKFVILLFLCSCSKNGSDGAPGPAGNPISAKMTQSMNCSAVISGLAGAAGAALNGISVVYNVSVMNSGDVFAEAEIANATSQITGSTIYSNTQTGASQGPVLIVDDFATPNGGYWTVSGNRTAGIFTAVYTDSTLGAQSPVTVTSNPSSCTVRNF